MTSETIAAAALRYFRRGWKLVAVGRMSKKPIGKGWQKRASDLAQFRGNINLGIQFGETSNGLCDVDLDSMLAIRLAPDFLPPTEAIFGRPSKPCSHHLYVSDLYQTEQLAAIQYKLFQNNDKAGASVVELRIGGNGKGAMSVVPPSIHVTGERVEWVRNGEPARVDGAALKQSVLKLALACLLQPGYPGNGSRHEGALVLGGVLARAGWSADDIGHLVQVLANAASDDDVRDRVNAATSAVTAKANGQSVAGLPRLGEIWGGDCADTLKRWLKLSGGTEKGAGLEDRLALDFAAKHADHLRYIAKSSQWMHWDGETWQSEDTLAAFDESRKLCRVAGDGKAKTVAAVERLARSDRLMAATIEQWDVAATLFNARKKPTS